jgi:hypothetical protein
MAVWISFLVLFLLWGSDCYSQPYKYVDKDGTICFTDNPPASIFQEDASKNKKKSQEEINQKRKSRPEIKDIMELGQEVLDKELAKPPEKQNRRLIQEMTEILYGDESGKKTK